MARAVAIVYTCKGNPGLTALKFAGEEPPFGHPWTKENTVAKELIYLPERAKALQDISDANARFNGDYERRLGVAREEYIYETLFPTNGSPART